MEERRRCTKMSRANLARGCLREHRRNLAHILGYSEIPFKPEALFINAPTYQQCNLLTHEVNQDAGVNGARATAHHQAPGA